MLSHTPYTYKETVEAANKAFKEKRLGFQKLDRSEECLYRYSDGGVCAIGAKVTDKDLEGIELAAGIDSFTFGYNGVFEEGIVGKLEELQGFHDQLCGQVKLKLLTIKQAEGVWRENFLT